jgi:hypothetical protein
MRRRQARSKRGLAIGWSEARVDERFLQAQIALVVQCLGEVLEDAPHLARAELRVR